MAAIELFVFNSLSCKRDSSGCEEICVIKLYVDHSSAWNSVKVNGIVEHQSVSVRKTDLDLRATLNPA